MPENSHILLNIADVFPVSYANGPGRRVVIWVQGCTINCKGCFNKDFQIHESRYLVKPGEFARKIIDTCRKYDCEGVTLTGGEPFQQSLASAILAGNIRRSGLTVVCFTGYGVKQLSGSENLDVQALLSKVDLLIGGPYNIKNKSKRTWFNDPDKELVFLTDRYSEEQLFDDEELEIIVKGSEVEVTGFPEKKDYETLEEMLDLQTR